LRLFSDPLLSPLADHLPGDLWWFLVAAAAAEAQPVVPSINLGWRRLPSSQTPFDLHELPLL
jgi:hypothetical protein